ncbi:G-protein coupled receptor 35-like [Leucoraja erinacea]|uniref:G-protein coupled receptor 35-like n=1 Tax=Leucoraja erinaceus TaxID=7782 RepID=UPI002458DCBF|nr:G-protein coupled receptor 35-like [Leucoraja erinacea]
MQNCMKTVPESVKVFKIVLFSLVFIVGIILNALALRTFCWKLRNWTETTIYMTSLAVSDLMVLVTLPFKIYSQYGNLSEVFLCKCVIMLGNLNMTISIVISTYICVDRYIAIKHPFKARVLRSPKKAALASAGAWIGTSLVILPFTFSTIVPDENLSAPCFNPDMSNSILYFIFVVVIFLIVPLITVTYCSVQIIQTLLKRPMSIAPAFNTKRTIQIIAANAVIFVSCFMPYNIAFIVEVAAMLMDADCTVQNQLYSFSHIAHSITNINCCLDAFIFYFVTADAAEYDQNQSKNNGHNQATLQIEL